MNYLEKNELPGMLLCLDFEKAFDSLDWDFMFKVLGAFGFGEGFCKWIETLYRNIKSTVIVNGKTTKWFDVGRGCRQGDPISPYLFVLAVEVMAIMIRENKDITGITTSNKENKISQFADDTQLFNNGDRRSFEASMQTIDKFGKTSGLFLNADKTEAVWLGRMKNSKVTFAPHLKIIWNPEQFKILGVWFGHNLNGVVERNFTEKFREAREMMKIWMKRSLTPLGRIAILKSLILSKLTHLWIFLPNPPHHVMEQIQKICFYFVWKGTHDRIKRSIVTKPVKEGGLNVPNVTLYSKSLKLMWMRKLRTSKHAWTHVCHETFKFAKDIEKFGPSYLVRMSNSNTFWKDVFSAYHDFSLLTIPQNPSDVLGEPVFYNPKIKIEGKVITFKSWIERGVSNISHFLKGNGILYTHFEFNQKFGIHTNFLTYASVLASITAFLKKVGVILNDNVATGIPLPLKIICSCVKGKKTNLRNVL
jgi:hypothetical protein